MNNILPLIEELKKLRRKEQLEQPFLEITIDTYEEERKDEVRDTVVDFEVNV